MDDKKQESVINILLQPFCILFIVVFAYITANISGFFAYYQQKAHWLDYFIGGWGAFIALALGLYIGNNFAKEKSDNNEIKDKIAWIMGILCAVIIEIGLNAWNIFSHL